MNGSAAEANTVDALFLHPGELYAGRRPARIKTILGSCIAITLWHPATGMAGMCHYVLAQRLRMDPAPDARDCDGRYGLDAIRFLQAAALATDRNLRQFRVGVFGGASIADVQQLRGSSVGQNNIELARQQLRTLGFRVDQWDVGGAGSRVLQLDTGSGQIQLKYHCNSATDPGRIMSGSKP